MWRFLFSFCWKGKLFVDDVLEYVDVGSLSIPVFASGDMFPCVVSHRESNQWSILPKGDDAESICARGLSKTFPDVPSRFHVSGGSFDRGSAYFKDLEELLIGCERGITFDCKLLSTFLEISGIVQKVQSSCNSCI